MSEIIDYNNRILHADHPVSRMQSVDHEENDAIERRRMHQQKEPSATAAGGARGEKD